MILNRSHIWAAVALCCLTCSTLSGCGIIFAGVGMWQTDIGGQTLPSAYYLDDDVQYFPHGPENPLPNATRAIEQYNLEQQSLRENAAIP